MEHLMTNPSTEKRGGNPDLKKQPVDTDAAAAERKLEQGLEESMAGSDPVSITQPAPRKPDQKN
jgi:hypothetical protein